MSELFPEEVEAYTAEYGLPQLPDYYDGPGARDLILFRQHDENVILTQCSLADAQAYCSRKSTHGNGWFCGFDHMARKHGDDGTFEPELDPDGNPVPEPNLY